MVALTRRPDVFELIRTVWSLEVGYAYAYDEEWVGVQYLPEWLLAKEDFWDTEWGDQLDGEVWGEREKAVVDPVTSS